MTPKLKKFIQENKYLINENTENSWEEIYNKLNDFILRGEFTTIMLSVGIDPAKILGYIPMYYLCESNIANYKIPNDAAYISYNAFSSCRSLANIEIPDSVTGIGDYAFYNCESLTNVIIPDSVIEIGDAAFYGCSSLTEIAIPDNVTSIAKDTFVCCDSLTSVVIGNRVTSIGDYAFEYCSSLKEIQYKGTKKQAIQLGIGNRSRKKWRKDSSIEKIICSDEEINLK